MVPDKAVTNNNGVFQTELFRGVYNVKVNHKSLKAPIIQMVDLDSTSEATIKA